MSNRIGNSDTLMNTGAKKIGSTVLTQAVILGLSFIPGFILPKYMGPENYGYWQIYVFYINYLIVFGLGFNDGFALFYGGYKFEELPFKRIRSSVRLFYGYLIIVSVILFAAAMLIQDVAKKNIFMMLAVNIPLVCLQYFVLTAFLSINKTSVYNGLNLLTKVLATSFFTGLLVINITSVNYMIGAETLARAIVTIICLFIGRKFLFGRDSDLRIGRHEFFEKTKYGINIMLGSIASSFIPVAGRVVIEHTHSISEYGLYSFVTALLMIIIIFTSSAGFVLFPVLKTLQEKHLPFYYSNLSYLCGNLIYAAYLVYVPFVLLIRYFMPEYIPIFSYMHILLAMCLPLGKVHLLIIPYFKALRFERSFLICNILGVLAMLASTLIAQWVVGSVFAIAVATTAVLFVWYYFVESYILKKMSIKRDRKAFLEDILFIIVFIVAAGLNNVWLFCIIYGILLVLYYLATYKRLLFVVKALRAENIEQVGLG